MGYYDESHRNEAPLSRKATHIAGFDLQYLFRHARHELSWGLGHRVTFDRFDGSFSVTMTPPRRTDQLFNTFVQDEIGLVEDRLALTLGSKLEHNSYTGFEAEPSARLLWTPSARHGFWGAVSRAARTPSRADCCIRMNVAAFPGPQGLSVLSVGGTPGFQSEYLWAYEAGYRVQPARWLSVDTAGFYNVYDGLRSQEQGLPFFENAPAPAHLVIPIRFQNGIAGSAHGLEIASKWQPVARWRLNADFTWLRLAMRQPGALPQAEAERLENTSPQYQAHLHSYLNLPGGLEFDAGLYYVDALLEHDIPRYLRADARVGWRWRGLEVSAGVENLADRSHPEFWERTDNTPETVGVGRSMYLKLSWRFD